MPPVQINQLISFDNAIYAIDVRFSLHLKRFWTDMVDIGPQVSAAFAVDNKVYIARWDSKVYYSEDEGINFSRLTTGLPDDDIRLSVSI